MIFVGPSSVPSFETRSNSSNMALMCIAEMCGHHHHNYLIHLQVMAILHSLGD